jgi:MFS family permease
VTGQGAGGLPPAQSRAGFRAWLSIAILLLLTFSNNIDRNIIGLLVDLIKADLKVTDFQFSLLHGLAFGLFYALASLPMGWAADRYSRRWILFWGASFWSICTAACGLAQTYIHLFVARFGVGVGEATLNPSAYSLVSDLFPRRRLTLALACLASGAAIAAGLGSAGGGYVIRWAQDMGGFAGYAPWQVVFWIVGLPGLVIAPLVFLIPRHVDHSRGRGSEDAGPKVRADQGAGFLSWLGGHKLYFLCLSFGVGAHTSLGTTAIWIPAFLARTQGLDIAQIGVLVGLITGLPTLIGYLGSGWLVDYLVSKGYRDVQLKYLVVNTFLLTVFGTLAYAFATSLTAIVILLSCASLMLPCAGPAIAHLHMAAPAAIRGRSTATFMMIMHVSGTVVGPSAAAFFSDFVYGGPEHIGSGLATVYALFGTVGVLLFATALKPSRRAAADAHGPALVVPAKATA